MRDAEAVRRLREAGAIVIGKTHAPEVGQWHFTETPLHGATRNPWNTDHTPGGSSGGAAAAVAAGVVPAAIGSDGAGSIRIPAAWTGLVGLKPQRGRVSTWPDPEAFNGLSCYGPLTRSVADAALLLDAIHGNVPADLHRPQPPQRALRRGRRARARPPADRGLLRAPPSASPRKVDAEHRAAIEAFAERLGDLGHEIVRVDPDYGLVGPTLIAAGHGRRRAVALRPTAKTARRWSRAPAPHARIGKALQGLPLRIARAAEPGLRRRIGRVFERCDVVLTPTTAKPPPRIGALDGRGYWATEQHGRRDLPLRLRLERHRLAGDQRPRRPHRRAACRSAPSCSAAKTTRRPCSRWPARSSALKAAGRGREGQSRQGFHLTFWIRRDRLARRTARPKSTRRSTPTGIGP